MYDFSRDLDEKGKKNLRDFVESGKGVVVLHHALLNYQKWAWWTEDVVGGRYRLRREGDDSLFHRQERPADLRRRPRDEHPITAGIGAVSDRGRDVQGHVDVAQGPAAVDDR